MAFKFNPLTGQFDLVGAGTVSSNYVFINPLVSDLTVPDPLIFLEHDMTISGTLTLLGSAELLVI